MGTIEPFIGEVTGNGIVAVATVTSSTNCKTVMNVDRFDTQ